MGTWFFQVPKFGTYIFEPVFDQKTLYYKAFSAFLAFCSLQSRESFATQICFPKSGALRSLSSIKFQIATKSWKPFAQKARGFESLFLRQKIRTSLAGVLIFCHSQRLSNAPLRLSESQNGVRIPHPKIEELALQAQGVGIFTRGEYPSSKPAIQIGICHL